MPGSRTKARWGMAARRPQRRDASGSDGAAERNPGVNLGGMLQSLGGFLEFLSNVAEKTGGEIHRTGEIGDDQKGMKAVYGFSVRMGGQGEAPHIQSFGNVKQKDRGPVVEESREPLVDVFDEDDKVVLIAELPGVGADDIRYEVDGDVLILTANHGDRKYSKEVLLSSPVTREGAATSYRNGVFELKLKKNQG
jgi:HSP20 family protein